MGYVIATEGDKTDPKYGQPGEVISITPSVTIGGRPVCTIDSPIKPHGNYKDPKRPGYKPLCGHAKVMTSSGTITIEGKPAAMLDFSKCTCGLHILKIPTGITTVGGGD